MSETARDIIRQATEGLHDDRPSERHHSTHPEWQLWSLRYELKQYALALVAAIEAKR